MRTWRIGLLALALVWGTSSAGIEPAREGQEAFLSRAVFVDGRVWLLSDAGELSSIVEGWERRIDGIHEIAGDGTARMTPLPEFKEIGGIAINFDLPRMILVLTSVNARRSVGGAVPLLVPRSP